MLLRVYSNRFLRNHTGMVVPRVFPSYIYIYIYIYSQEKLAIVSCNNPNELLNNRSEKFGYLVGKV